MLVYGFRGPKSCAMEAWDGEGDSSFDEQARDDGLGASAPAAPERAQGAQLPDRGGGVRSQYSYRAAVSPVPRRPAVRCGR